ncbi:EscU/YscU/HrcU family type III secretion system export apparatus switch protein [Gracilibacillus sp. YIM 98692]|uniref:EscU/YscU/HrcU family type III secretion system export apparatus switch protein n=1 Tax=Gracilibacillus sp. YIM 98692 TaxID=2663532 RepID=UPI0013D59C70|nr:EscU/YscU/HrcU family type III secretion system export apparatus switch protein [Gracilibacillus sp. YIM 98692]
MTEKDGYQKKAAALTYDPNQVEAPKLTAKGRGYVAESIIEKAKENEIPIQSDPTLVQLLSELNINETIPEELYQVVAEVFAYIYQIDKSIDQSK